MKRSGTRNLGFTAIFGVALIGAAGCSDADPAPAPGAADMNGGSTPGGPVAAPEQTTSSAPIPGTPPATPPPSCSFETRSFFVADGGVVESITRGGRLFNFESNGAAWQINGIDLTDVQGYANGPCRGRARGQCAFDTRTFVPVGDSLVESITAYGSYWTFDTAGEARSTDLALLPRYRTGGPCEGRAPGQCSFQTRTFYFEGGKAVEAITAYGKSYRYTIDGAPLSDNGLDLTKVPRFAAGPCAGVAAGECVFTTRVFESVDGHVLETVTANGKIYRYVASGAAASAEVQPSNVPLDSIEPWASGVCKK